jgi:hypothetical protein
MNRVTQFSEDNDDYTGGQYCRDYNDIDEASKDMQISHRYVEEVDAFCIVAVKYTADGVASRKDKESRSTFIRPEDHELIVAKQQSIINSVNSYICPAAIYNLEKESVRQRPPTNDYSSAYQHIVYQTNERSDQSRKDRHVN